MQTEKVQTIDIAPSWETAVAVYMAVLENPNASESGKESARQEIRRLARMFDQVNEEG